MALIPIGQILVENGALNEEQLEEALAIQKESAGKKLGDVLIDLKYITQDQFMQAYAKKLMVDYVHLEDYEIDEAAVAILGEDLSVSKNILAIKVENNNLTVATSSPLDFYQLDNIRLTTGYDITAVLSSKDDIKRAIANIYSVREQQDVLEQVNTDFNIEAIADLDKEIEGLGEKIDSAPVVKLANTLIYDAYRNGVSDIHIEPSKGQTRIRVRIDGELVEQMKISKAAHNALITRLKIMSDLNIAEKRVPQDGRCGIAIDGQQLDLRVSTLPTIDGEKMVIRLLGSSVQEVTKLSMLGMCDRDFTAFTEMLKNPNGIIMVTGPTGSGKTTTLYAALDEIAKPSINVVTVEDPVEKNIDGINQVHINTKAGLTFAEGLRSILRQDPDVVMIGEIRDGETASIAVRAAITGHLVLSTIHTNDAISTVSRLVDMGVEPYLVASSLVGIVAQRLVKLCCPKCSRDVQTTPEDMKLLGITEPATIKECFGCEHCANTGYKGRTAIYEMVTISRKLKTMISKGEPEVAIKAAAKLEGATFLRESATELVLNGTIDMRQLIRTTYGMED